MNTPFDVIGTVKVADKKTLKKGEIRTELGNGQVLVQKIVDNALTIEVIGHEEQKAAPTITKIELRNTEKGTVADITMSDNTVLKDQPVIGTAPKGEYKIHGTPRHIKPEGRPPLVFVDVQTPDGTIIHSIRVSHSQFEDKNRPGKKQLWVQSPDTRSSSGEFYEAVTFGKDLKDFLATTVAPQVEKLLVSELKTTNADLAVIALEVARVIFNKEATEYVNVRTKQHYPIEHTKFANLRVVKIKMGEDTFEFLEQNPNKEDKKKPGQLTAWAQRAKNGEQIMWVTRIHKVGNKEERTMEMRVENGSAI